RPRAVHLDDDGIAVAAAAGLNLADAAVTERAAAGDIRRTRPIDGERARRSADVGRVDQRRSGWIELRDESGASRVRGVDERQPRAVARPGDVGVALIVGRDTGAAIRAA